MSVETSKRPQPARQKTTPVCRSNAVEVGVTRVSRERLDLFRRDMFNAGQPVFISSPIVKVPRWPAVLPVTRVFVKELPMLYTIAVILLIAWLLGVVGTYTIGAFVHVLLVVALVLFVLGLLSGRRTIA